MDAGSGENIRPRRPVARMARAEGSRRKRHYAARSRIESAGTGCVEVDVRWGVRSAMLGKFEGRRRALFPAALAAAVALFLAFSSPVAAQGGTAEPVTFSRDVAPILQRSCQQCQRPDGIAPMSVTTFEEVRPWARVIQGRVEARAMPPGTSTRRLGSRNTAMTSRLQSWRSPRSAVGWPWAPPRETRKTCPIRISGSRSAGAELTRCRTLGLG